MRRPLARSLVIGRPGLFYGSAVRDYLDRVRAADGDGLSRGVTNGINTYISGLIYANMLGTSGGVISQAASTIKAHCIMSGVNTLAGAFVPVVGPAPINFNFVAGDYLRKTGLGKTGNVSAYLDTNRNNNTDPQDNQHIAVYSTVPPTGNTKMYFGAGGSTGAAGTVQMIALQTAGRIGMRNRSSSFTTVDGLGYLTGMYGMSRNNSASFAYRAGSTEASLAITSQTPFNGNIQIFASEGVSFSDARFAFYSIGESLALSTLAALQAQLLATFAAAIP